MTTPPTECVILLHGLGGHRWLMQPLARRIHKAGYQVQLWGYRSFLSDTATHAQHFASWLSQLALNATCTRIHIVAHSLGSIVTRLALLHHVPQNPRLAELIGRTVMICPPNHGSHAARRLTPWVGWLSRPLVELSDSPHSLVRSLPEDLALRHAIGIIRASRDYVVSPGSTELQGVTQYTTIPATHSSVLFSRRTAEQTLHLLSTGKFLPNS
ncbi:esterase/lipase family protein [Aureliella helgolandensis]|uniref:Alpha/beta hydrolase family protein n=1 Tax=Aureliella helgolandensis TaxID=2527968 RepID=A0A518G0C7_9BACT|nr:alpha/beta hydrolase [Aureliella helgolandensis]QDV22062.1 Alpha/beta hydrolase family protein [Aureliella helgolandensis]